MEGRGITNGRMGISNSFKGNSAREREGEVGERTGLYNIRWHLTVATYRYQNCSIHL